MSAGASRKDLLAGLVFVGVGAAFGYAATGYPLGTAFRMGPGYFPLILAGALVVLGAAIMIKGLTPAAADEASGPVPWRGMLLLVAALIFFGTTVRGLGLGPALFVAAFLAALASRRNGLGGALLLAAGLAAFGVLVFIYALRLPYPVIGPWLRG